MPTEEETVELEYYHLATSNELRDLGKNHQSLLTSHERRQADSTRLPMDISNSPTKQALPPY